ncbi:hypothetical protein BU17DRAFT_88375 [Hysterangium stoloniferum]|nr:hypothetical protein BU17DRAFT_88375 [Hysterangium stoloniferum]
MSIFDVPQSNAPIIPLLVVLTTVIHILIANVLASPGGAVSHVLGPLIFFAKSDLQRITAITGFFFFVTYTVTSGLSLMGAALGNPEGYKNKGTKRALILSAGAILTPQLFPPEPRLAKDILTGFPHRLTALHDNLLEIFPAFVICAAITLALPIYGVDHLVVEKSINYLLLAAFSKTFIYVPAYAIDWDNVRSFAHLLAIGSLLGLLIGVVTA